MKSIAAYLHGVLLATALAVPAFGFEMQIDLSGAMVASDSNCPGPVPVFNQDDCSYNASDPTGFGQAEWIGPLFNAGYYAPGTSPGPAIAGANDPVPGDGKTPPSLSGTLRIEDQDTGAVTDDTIEASLVIGQTVRNFGAGARGTGEETWTSLTMHFGPVVVSSATANGNGGSDYVIGSLGMPARLVDAATGTDIWPSETGSDSDAAITGGYWAAPGAVGIAPIEGNPSIGTTATFTATGYGCVDVLDGIGGAASACDARGLIGDGVTVGGTDFENILLAVSTDAAGDVTAATLIWVQQQDVLFTPAGPDGWVAGLIEFTGGCNNCASQGEVPLAPDFAVATEEGSPVLINVTAAPGVQLGDRPSSLSIVSPATNGVATVIGSSIRYSPTGFFFGTDSFQYAITDVNGDSATGTLTVNVLAQVPVAVDDTASVVEGQSVAIVITSNDDAGSGPMSGHVITITRQPAIGSVSVGADNRVTFEAPPDSFPGDSFEYTLTDGNGDVSAAATVEVGIGHPFEPPQAGGVSAFDPWILLFLSGLLLSRAVLRRKNRVSV